jgi:hypothetical protein
VLIEDVYIKPVIPNPKKRNIRNDVILFYLFYQIEWWSSFPMICNCKESNDYLSWKFSNGLNIDNVVSALCLKHCSPTVRYKCTMSETSAISALCLKHCNPTVCYKRTMSETSAIWLIDWLFTVLRPAQEFFTYMETLPLPVKGCKIWAYARRSGPLSREGSLSCHTCCDKGPRFFRSHRKDRPIQSPLTTHEGMWRIYFNSDQRIMSETL